MSLAHHQEALDAHMNHFNQKKMVHMGIVIHVFSLHYIILILQFHLQFHPSSRGMKRMEVGMDLSAEAFASLTKHVMIA
jgi:hypothetical protein